jgi:hypothetical protein
VKVLLAALNTTLLLFTAASNAATPCDFKGVSVGDKISPQQIMTAYGVAKYKMNPKLPSFEENLPNIQKYGVFAAGEIRDWNIGPYCDDRLCTIPWGVSVGNSDHIPVSVHVGFHSGQITEIDVSFGSLSWDEVLPLLDKKYGRNWKVERDPSMVLTDLETKQHLVVERITLNHRSGGVNTKTRDTCQIWATNYDVVFYHHDPLGQFHSVFVIKLVSKNF